MMQLRIVGEAEMQKMPPPRLSPFGPSCGAAQLRIVNPSRTELAVSPELNTNPRLVPWPSTTVTFGPYWDFSAIAFPPKLTFMFPGPE